MSRARQRLSVVAGLVAGLLALALFAWLVGVEQVVSTVASLDPLPFALGLVAVVGGVGAQFLALAALLGVRPSVDGALAYLRGVYGRQLLPVGNVAGPVLIAYSMRSATGIPTDRALPATIIAQAATFLGSTVVAFGGTVALVAGGRSELLPVAGVLAVVGVGWIVLVGALVAGADLDRIVHSTAAAVNRTLGRLSGRVATRTSQEAIGRGLGEFDDARRLIREDPRRIVVAAALSVLGWTLLCVPAVTTGVALGTPIALAVACVAVPVSDFLNVIPVPGGIGGVEVVLAGSLVALAGVDLAAAAVIAFCVRLCTYWFVLLLGGTATTLLSTRAGVAGS
ncbi:lysylphosphatidylglycerol synthase transmembrane domain-containing protein [Halolamina salina]|uniref:Lysylphosphatidylglycerol synthase transmembrane domain-containing protein n=2 Tax=Halolamina salina TaxID=1220023 RepID=A0ABD6B2R8_9EURY